MRLINLINLELLVSNVSLHVEMTIKLSFYTVAAEYLARGYKLSDQILEHAIAIDSVYPYFSQV